MKKIYLFFALMMATLFGAQTVDAVNCLPPTNVQISEITNYSALVTWTPGENQTKWVVYVQDISSAMPGSPSKFDANTSSCQIIGLSGNTTYLLKVMTVCSDIGYDWSVATQTTFTTACACTIPQDLQVSDIKDKSATFSWTSSDCHTQWEVYLSDDETKGHTYPVESNPCTIEGRLIPNTPYYAEVRAVCGKDKLGDNIYSNWSQGINFTTAPEATCKAPVDLKATNVSYNEATIIWYIGNIGQNKWYITYKSKDQSDFYSGEEVNTTAFTLKNLSPETEYEVKVKAICSSSDESEYTESIFFTTPQKPVANAQAYTVLNGNVLTYYYDNKYEEYQDAGYPVKMNPGYDGCVSNDYRSQVKTINIDPSMQNYTPTIMTRFFSASNPYAMEALTAINGLQYLNTSKVKYMSYMFYKCEALETIDLSSLNTSNVEDMNHMFYGCEKLATITGIETLNTSKVTDMHDMFVGCHELVKLDLHQWDVSSVTNMEYMFSTCKNLKELDLTGFDVSNVENMYAMFYDSRNLTTIYCEDNWNTTATALTNSKYMFETCNALQGDNGTKWAAGNPKDITYARPDGGTEAPGYFSKKEVTGMEEVSHQPSAVSCQKVLRDGQLYLMYEGRMYDVRGNRVK